MKINQNTIQDVINLLGHQHQKIKAIEGVKSCRVEITFEPTWDQEMMSEAAKLELGFL